MNYVDPVKYSKTLKKLNENAFMEFEDQPQVEETMTMRERISQMSPDNKKKLKEYVDAIKEIKKSIEELINGGGEIEEQGGNMSSGLYLNPTEEE